MISQSSDAYAVFEDYNSKIEYLRIQQSLKKGVKKKIVFSSIKKGYSSQITEEEQDTFDIFAIPEELH